MKTQINSLVKGDHRTSTSGTTFEKRSEIAKLVISENPEKMTIRLKGTIINLIANWSLSRKSVCYFSEIPLSLYQSFFENWGIINNNPKAFIQINSDMSVWMTTNSKKRMHQIVPEAEIEIL